MSTYAQAFGGVAVAALLLAGFAFASSAAASPANKQAPVGYGGSKVEICHKGKTLSVAAPAVRAHEAHGDIIGACE